MLERGGCLACYNRQENNVRVAASAAIGLAAGVGSTWVLVTGLDLTGIGAVVFGAFSAIWFASLGGGVAWYLLGSK